MAYCLTRVGGGGLSLAGPTTWSWSRACHFYSHYYLNVLLCMLPRGQSVTIYPTTPNWDHHFMFNRDSVLMGSVGPQSGWIVHCEKCVFNSKHWLSRCFNSTNEPLWISLDCRHSLCCNKASLKRVIFRCAAWFRATWNLIVTTLSGINDLLTYGDTDVTESNKTIFENAFYRGESGSACVCVCFLSVHTPEAWKQWQLQQSTG